MTPSIQRFDTNARMSHVVVHAGVAYLAGTIASDLTSDIETQTRQALADIEHSLSRVGSDKTRLLSAQIWMKNLTQDFPAMNAVWEAWIPAGHAPSRATCQASMAAPEILVEIIVTAAVGA
jgi:enamine deaminase RidA (YjgF/YER057c/UK114 family)